MFVWGRERESVFECVCVCVCVYVLGSLCQGVWVGVRANFKHIFSKKVFDKKKPKPKVLIQLNDDLFFATFDGKDKNLSRSLSLK